jgi:hypothetical protein
MLFYPDQRAISAATQISIGVGTEQRGVDFQVPPVRTHRVSGRVEPAATVAGSLVKLVDPDLEELGFGFETEVTRLADDGSFTFGAVPAGTYTLASADWSLGLRLRPSEVAMAEPRLPSFDGRSAIPSVSGGQVGFAAGVVYDLFAPPAARRDAGWSGRLEGIVVADADRHGLTMTADDLGTVIVSIVDLEQPETQLRGTVEISSASLAGPITLRNSSVRADPASSVAISSFRVPSGEYVIRLATGFSNFTMHSMMVAGEDYADRPIVVPSGAVMEVRVVLTSLGARIEGRIAGSGSGTGPSCRAFLIPTDRQSWERSGMTPTSLRQVLVARDGRFSFDRVRPGDYHLVSVMEQAVSEGTSSSFLQRAASRGLSVSVKWGDTRSLVVPCLAIGR